MNNNCVYFVEGDCEEKLINALKKKPELILPGKVVLHNLIQEIIPNSRLIAITPKTKVVFVFDTDVDKTDILKKNIDKISRYCQNAKVIFLPQVLNLEDELVRCTDVSEVKEITRSKSNSNFKGDFCKLTDARLTLTKHHLDILSLWTSNPPEPFTFVPRTVSKLKRFNLHNKADAVL